MNESIFWLIFRNATAHRNQMKILPATWSLPEAAIAFSTSVSLVANTWAVESSTADGMKQQIRRMLFFFKDITSNGQRIGQESAYHGYKQTKAPCVHDEQEELPAKHPAPGAEDVRCVFGGSGCKCDRSRENQYPDNDVSFCRLKAEELSQAGEYGSKGIGKSVSGSGTYYAEIYHVAKVKNLC